MTRSASSSRASKILSLLAAALVLAPSLAGQSKDADKIRASVARASKAVRNPGKAAKTASWLSLAEAYEDAYSFPLSNLVPGEGNSVRTLSVRGQRPREIMAATPVSGIYKNVYSDKDIYFDADGKLLAIRVTRPLLDTVDALAGALEAYKKAYACDQKGSYTDRIADHISHIATEYRTLAEVAGMLGESGQSMQYYRLSAAASMTPPCQQPDLPSLRIVAAEDERLMLERAERERIARLKASALDIYERGAEEYRAAMAVLDRAAALPAGEDKAFQQLQTAFREQLLKASVSLKQSYMLTDDAAVREKAGSLLRGIALFFGVESLDDLGD